MSVSTAISKAEERLSRPVKKNFPEPPIVLVSGPQIELSAGDPDRPFWIASIDKVFIGTLISQLMEDGRCDPGTPIGSLLPAGDIAPLPTVDGVDAGRDITVHHLLSHTSGLPDIIEPPKGHRTECSDTEIQKNPSRLWPVKAMLEQVRDLPPIARPGEKFSYGDTAYLLLIRIAEHAFGASFDELLRSRIFEPSGMTDSAQWVDPDSEALESLRARMAPFAVGSGREMVWQDLIPNLTWQGGLGGVSTANDLVRFQQHLHNGGFCTKESVGRMSKARNRLRPGIHYGAGMATVRFGGFSPFLRGYPQPFGGLGYTATHMFYYPAQHTHVILGFHSHKAMTTSFREHIRLAGLIKAHG